MRQEISDDKKDILLDKLASIDEQVDDLMSKLEEDENIPESNYRTYEAMGSKLSYSIRQLEEEIR